MDTLSPAARSERMSRVKARDTKPELALRRLVWSMGYRYRKNCGDVAGRPDIAFIGRKRTIFLHGCFWHRHHCASGVRAPKSRRAFWNAKFEANVARDAAVSRLLRADGWRTLIVWECEMREPARVERRVRRFLDA